MICRCASLRVACGKAHSHEVTLRSRSRAPSRRSSLPRRTCTRCGSRRVQQLTYLRNVLESRSQLVSQGLCTFAVTSLRTDRLHQGAAAKAKLESQIKTLQEEVAAIDSANSEATALRSKENAEYTKASAEYKMSADAVANAIQTLQEYSWLLSIRILIRRIPIAYGADWCFSSVTKSSISFRDADLSMP